MAEIGTITTLFLTAAGLRLQAKVQAGRTPLILTRVKIGYGYLQDDMDLKSLTGPINEVPSHQTGEEGTTATVDLTRVYDDTQEGMAYVGISVKNGDNPRFFLREFDVFADDPDVGEICYGIANLGDEAPPVSPYDGRNHIEYKYDFPTVIANADDVVANITLAADTPWEDFVRLENVVKGLSAATFFPTNAGVLLNITAEQVALWNNMISMLMKGAANGVAELDANGLVPASQLPSYVDDVLNGTAQGVTETGAGTYSATGFILKGQTALCTPEDDKTYIDTATNIQYRWTGTVFVSMGSNLVLGETSRSAGRGDWTKTAYDHSQSTHAPTTAATPSAMGLMSAADKKKLDGIAEGAQPHKAPTGTEVLEAIKDKSPELAAPTANTPLSTDNSKRVATTAFVQSLLSSMKKDIDMLKNASVSSTYLKYYNNRDNYDVISDLSGTGISLSEYRNDVTSKGIYQITNTSVLPASSSNPVFFKEDAYMSGDESEISNNQYLLYDNGDTYKRTRYLGYISGQWTYPSNPQFGEWQKLESYHVVF